jgi:uncharacterized protein (DUF433 family)
VEFGELAVKGTRLPISVIARELATHGIKEPLRGRVVEP